MKFPKCLNICLELNESLRRSITEINDVIVADGFSEISFAPPSDHIPHVTLLMGEVEGEGDFINLTRAVTDFAACQSPFDYSLSKPYLKRPSQHFIFVDTLPQDHFKAFRRSLHDSSGEYMECEHHGGPDNPSHITVGYAKPIYSRLGRLASRFRRTKGRAENIQICEAGRRGTCIKDLHKIPIG